MTASINLVFPIYVKLHQSRSKPAVIVEKKIASRVKELELAKWISLKQVTTAEQSTKLIYEIRVPVQDITTSDRIGQFLDTIFGREFRDLYPSYTEPIGN